MCLGFYVGVWADSKISDLDAITDIQGTDVFLIVDDPGGSPSSKKITATDVFDMINTPAKLETISNSGAYASDILAATNEANFKSIVNLEANTDFYAPGGTDVPVTDGGTSVSTLALNGILYGTGATDVGVTAIGAAGQILRAGADPFVPAWSTSTFADTYAIGGLLVASGANTVTALATGATGQVLIGATGAVPAWGTNLPTATTIGSK